MKSLPLVCAVLALAIAEQSPLDESQRSDAPDAKSIFVQRCSSCHGPDKQRGGLRFDRKSDALAGGDSGRAIVPGKPNESPLLKRVTSRDENERMPPKGPRLTDAEVAALRTWIVDGAKWPDATDESNAGQHWSFKPVVRPPTPKATGTTNPIDAFVLSKLSDNGLSLSPPADRRTLIRRLKFDLLGLPPTPEEVDAFVRDRDSNAYEKLVDRYLASPHYGERWARHWLDVVRFAESHGFEMNWERPNAWHYRDWVIRSLNEDQPYDRFVMEQIAGDSLDANAATGFLVGGPWDQVKSPDPALTAQQRADELHDMIATTGTAFLGLTVGCARCHNHKFDPVPQVDYYRLKAVFSGVQHGERPLASGVTDNARAIATLRAELATLDADLAALEPLADPHAISPRRLPVNVRLNTERFSPVRASVVRFVILACSTVEPCIDELEIYTAGPFSRNIALASEGATLRASGVYPNAPAIHRLEFLNDGMYGNGRSWISNTSGRGWVEVEFKQTASIDRVLWSRDREGKYSDRLATQYRIEVRLASGEWVIVASSNDRVSFGSPAANDFPGLTPEVRQKRDRIAKNQDAIRGMLASLERLPRTYGGRLTEPEPTFRLHRGDAMQKREAIAPGGFINIGPPLEIPANSTDRERRLALAKWIASRDNPLTSRVIVNRLWQFHFGTGLVDTPSDFGKNGGKPSHSELLDWLAAELVQPGVPTVKPWSLKHIHRLIVTSATYQQASIVRPSGLAKDAQNRLLWRFSPQRLEAEAIRDSILAVSGKLDLTMGGPGFSLFEPNTNYVRVYSPKVKLGPPEFRRMVYMHKARMQTDNVFGAFDCPDAGQIAPKRNASTTPLQALNLLNSPFMLDQAGFFADRVEKEAGSDITAQVRRAFRLAFQREPSNRELDAAVELVLTHGLPALCRALFNANEFLYVD